MDVTVHRDSAEFWHEFSKNLWERLPFAVPSGFTDVPKSADSLFESVVSACREEHRNVEVGVRFYAGNQEVDLESFTDYLPCADDGSLEAYNERVTAKLDGEPFALLINNLEALDFELWDWSRRFLRQVFTSVGMKNLGVYYALFLGTYRRTPQGVHHDPESVFHLPVVGRKRMRVWSPAYVSEHPELRNATHYHGHLGDSVLLEAEPGGMIYWPSNLWHVGESSGEFNASLALSLLCMEPRDPLFAVYLRQLLHHRGDDRPRPVNAENQLTFNPHNLQETGERLPAWLVQTASAMRKLFSEDNVSRLWFRLTTGYGFYNVPLPAADVQVASTDTVQGDVEFPIICRDTDAGGVEISVNGNIIGIPNDLPIHRFLDHLNSGRPERVKNLLSDVGDGADADALLSVLQSIAAFRGIRVL